MDAVGVEYVQEPNVVRVEVSISAALLTGDRKWLAVDVGESVLQAAREYLDSNTC